MTQNDEKPIRAVTVQQFEAEQRRRRNGPGGERPPSLWEKFNDKVSDMTRDLRLRARGVINEEIRLHEASVPAPGQVEACKAHRDYSLHLQQRFATVVGGGVQGACVAAKAVWNATGGGRTPQAKCGPYDLF